MGVSPRGEGKRREEKKEGPERKGRGGDPTALEAGLQCDAGAVTHTAL